MLRVCILLALAIARVAAQDASANAEAAPEPYSYGYQTDTHAASEQRDPSGKVTGFYTLADADGRERRVEYIADEAGFRAKVSTNELGTKSESPADVELVASEPTPAQLVYQAPAQQQVVRQQQVVQQRVATAQPARNAQAQYVQQPSYGYGYGYYPGYGYGNAGYGYGNAGYGNAGYGSAGYGNAGYGNTRYSSSYSSGYYPSYGYGNQAGYGFAVGNYNNHLPSQYYRSVGTLTNGVNPATYNVGSQGVRYANQPAVSTTGVRTYSSQSYTTGSAGASNPQGSSNYLVLQKRSAAATEEKKSS